MEARKRALVAESEVYRQTLRLDVQNLLLYGAGVRRRFEAFKSSPLFALTPVAVSLLGMARGARRGKRSFRWWRLALKVLLDLRVYRRLLPMLQGFARGQMSRAQSSPALAEEETPAANI